MSLANGRFLQDKALQPLCQRLAGPGRGCVETQLNFQLSLGWVRLLHVVDQNEADNFLRSNLKTLIA